MKLLLIILLVPSLLFSQNDKKKYALHLGSNVSIGYIGGTVRGGGLGLSPRIGLLYKEHSVIGIESLANYQIAYQKDTITSQSIYLAKWVGPFFRYYLKPSNAPFNLYFSGNYIWGSLYVNSYVEQFRKVYSTGMIGLGGSAKIKDFLIEFGFRYTLELNDTPRLARQINTITLGITRNF